MEVWSQLATIGHLTLEVFGTCPLSEAAGISSRSKPVASAEATAKVESMAFRLSATAVPRALGMLPLLGHQRNLRTPRWHRS